MSKLNNNKNNMGKTKRSTDDLINDAIAQQNDWLENRRTYTRGFLKSLNLFARPADKKIENQSVEKDAIEEARNRRSAWTAYWFPIMCALLVIFIAIWVMFIRGATTPRIVVVPAIPEPVVQKVAEITVPEFDIVRIQKDGTIVIAGRWLAHQNISIVVNGKIVATERTNANGEFAYVTSNPWKPGNYTIALLGADPEVKSSNKVFVYVSEHGVENSVSLLMTKDGSTLLQTPAMLRDGDLAVSKIDYLDTGRIVVTGDALPRLRVSLTLDDKYMGFARVSDHKHYGLGADVGELESGKEYELGVRLHDGDGRVVATVLHKFIMPEMTGDDDTFYTVRRGDCLWIIARNFLRRGILFSIVAERNNIENPDLIFPKQKLQIPVSGK
ncbi:MAG: LysM peptidoglycan-binding domain-containing protein [Alphaproteobacteria bacterium]|nr:LysM peptidoglycan-binding domain-containing protein [Alphaproteobacteria bacterium]